jgi:flagellar biosynthesis protein FlhG
LVLAVGGGKGGIGKSFVSAALAASLASFRKRVILVDADFAGANLHTLMGIAIPNRTIHDFFSRQIPSLAEAVLPTPIERLSLICGAAGSIGVANLPYADKQKFLRHLRKLEADVIVLDLGAGMSFNEIDLFNSADTSIVVANPEPTSVQECYNFLKVALYRRLRKAFAKSAEALAILEQKDDDDHVQDNRLMVDLGREYYKLGKAEGDLFSSVINSFNPKLILNRVFNLPETHDGLALQIAVGDMMRVHLEYWGYLGFDPITRKALREMKPQILLSPASENAERITKIVQKFLLNEGTNGATSNGGYYEFAKETSVEPIDESVRICSIRCRLWGKCIYQDGGLPCTMPEEEYQRRAGAVTSVK